MVDIHTHLLFGVDDGPVTLKESIELIKQGMNLGYKNFVLTSHYGYKNYSNKNYENENYFMNYMILTKKLKELDWDVNIYMGNEILLNEGINKTFKEKKFFNIENSKYILVELEVQTIPSVGKLLLERVLKEGYKPILAHIERYESFKVEDFKALKDLGIKFQVNISGVKASKKIRWMLEKGYIDFLGSDTHRLGRRDYNLKNDFEYIKTLVGEEEFLKLTKVNGEKLLLGKEIKDSKKESIMEGINEKKDSSRIFRGMFRGLCSNFRLRRDFR